MHIIQPSLHVTTTLLYARSPLTSPDVEKLLEWINAYSAMGPDDIHPRILKEAANVLALPLFTLFTDSLLTGVLPAASKQEHMTSIYKSGDRYSPASCRPISLTNVTCKTLETQIK